MVLGISVTLLVLFGWIAMIFLIAAAIVTIIVAAKFSRQNAFRQLERKIRELLKNPTAEPLIEFFRSSGEKSRMSPEDRAAWVAGCSGFYYAIYGNFESVRSTIDAVPWDRCNLQLRTGMDCNLALLCFLESGDFSEGLAHCRSALKVAGQSKGSGKLVASFQLYVMIGETLCTLETDPRAAMRLLRSLEAKKNAWFCDLLILNWALLYGYRKLGNELKANKCEKWLLEAAPHCKALLVS
jgi:hypothetical protein